MKPETFDKVGFFLFLIACLGSIMVVAPFMSYKGQDPRGFLAVAIPTLIVIGVAMIFISVRIAKKTRIDNDTRRKE